MGIESGNRILMRGNEAIAYGALMAGLETYYAYPITPSTEVPETFSHEFGKPDWPDFKVFMQAPSEIEAISMTIGSAATGAKSMTFTSSPGFSLKQEGISYAVTMEIPMVIGNVNRSGPGLGNIAAEQSDYLQATKGGGHGGYHLIVLAPNTVQEIATFPKLAFDLAYKYRNPVVIMIDAFTGQLKEDIVFPEIKKKNHDISWALTGAKGRDHNILNSLYLEVDEMEAVSDRLWKKWAQIAENEVLYEEWECRDAEVIVVAYGLPSRIAKDAVRQLRKEGCKVGMFRPQTLWPFPHKRLAELGKTGKKFVVAELNHGQMIEDVRASMFGLGPVPIIGLNRWGGNYFTIEAVKDKIRNIDETDISKEVS
jgi:pyruvate/2-oxoacid:ferredoxin oxidoreductase alpha subunit